MFDVIVKHVINLEGGLNVREDDHANYREGILVGTKYGISAKYHPNVDILNLTKEQATQIYKEKYWDVHNLDNVNPAIAAHVFDFAVNSGNSRAMKMLKECDTVSKCYAYRKEYFESLRTKFPQFIRGWLNRLESLDKFVAELESQPSRLFIVANGVSLPIEVKKISIVGNKVYAKL